MWQRVLSAAASQRLASSIRLSARRGAGWLVAAAALPVTAATLLAAQHRPLLAAPASAAPPVSAASPAGPGSKTAASSGQPNASQPQQQLQSEEDQECPWCTAMTQGGCASEFVAWRNCSRRVQQEAAALMERGDVAPESVPVAAKVCMPLFQQLDRCVRTPGPTKRDYYRTVLPLDSRDVVEPTEEEKLRDANSDRDGL